MSQKAKLLELLRLGKRGKYGRWVTSREIMKTVYGVIHEGACRYSSRLSELKVKHGYNIERKHVKGTVWAWRVVGKTE